MHTGISPAAALYPDLPAAEKFAQSVLKDFLNGDPVGLKLPAVIVGAVEADFHAVDFYFFAFAAVFFVLDEVFFSGACDF